MHRHGLPRDDQFTRSTTSAIRRRPRRLVRVHTRPRSLAGNPTDLSRRRTSTSALPGVPRTAHIVVEPHHHGRTAPIPIATQPPTTTVACAAVSSLEACPTPALRPVQLAALPRARAGVRQPLTAAPVRSLELQTFDKPSMPAGTTRSLIDRFGDFVTLRGRRATSAVPWNRSLATQFS